MKVIFVQKCESINSLPEIDLPDLTVLTGVNGAGKTHLLRGMSSGRIKLEIEGKKVGSIIHFNNQDFIFQDGNVRQLVKNTKQNAPYDRIKKFVDEDELTKELRIVQDKVRVFFDGPYTDTNTNNASLNMEKLMYHEIFHKIIYMPIDRLDEESTFEEISKDLSRKSPFRGENINTIYSEAVSSAKNMRRLIGEDSLVNKFHLIAKEAKTDLLSLTAKHLFYGDDLLGQELMREFIDYRYLQYRNDIERVRSEREGGGQYLSEEKFRIENGIPPWELLNQVLKEYRCSGYSMPTERQIAYPHMGQTVEDFYIPLCLVSQHENRILRAESLSSGEKTLLALALLVYRQRKKKEISLSDVLLLDEIDGNLHPSMIEQLLNALKNIFIKEHGMKVILVTHSPTTIALAPDSSIFIMHRDGSSAQRIEKKDRGDALDILTEGYATLDKGLRLFDQISRKEISIITEGWNVDYLRKANKFCSDTTVPYVFRKNNKNGKVRKGVENLFLQELTDRFYTDERIAENGSIVKNLDKNKLREHLIANGSKDDFIKFKPLFEDIKKELRYKSK